jgi:hypothetical protein
MSRLTNSSTELFDASAADARQARTKMVWSFSWEFDWSPASAAHAHSLQDNPQRSGADELNTMLDKALAYAG